MRSINLKGVINYTIISGILFAAFVSINSPRLNNVALYVVIPVAFGLSVVQYGVRLSTNRYLRWLLVLYCWIGITYFGYIGTAITVTIGFGLIAFSLGLPLKRLGKPRFNRNYRKYAKNN